MENTAWKYSNAAGRWAGFGPYYAMFPINFARQVIEDLTPEGGSILDPFCGRGTAPFVAQASGRRALGIDSNPVAWVFSKVKTAPEPDKIKLIDRLKVIQNAVTAEDKKSDNEFQEWAWSEKVLGFLNASRRMLKWREDITDRTLMGFILVHLHAKLGCGISNQMQQARALGPDYAVRWWQKRKMQPPDLDPHDYFRRRIEWRYMHGVVKRRSTAEIIHGDSTKILSNYSDRKFDLLFTSPPYFNITDYRQDSWIRLWLLNEGPPLPDWKQDNKTTQRELYQQMLLDIFCSAYDLLNPYAVIWIRTDAREFTKNATLEALRSVWPKRKRYMRIDLPKNGTQTAHFGNKASKSGEIDFLIPGRKLLPAMSSNWNQM